MWKLTLETLTSFNVIDFFLQVRPEKGLKYPGYRYNERKWEKKCS